MWWTPFIQQPKEKTTGECGKQSVLWSDPHREDMFSDQTPAVMARLKEKEKQKLFLILTMPLNYFRTTTFALRQQSSHKERLICWPHYYSNRLHIPRYGPTMHPTSSTTWSRTLRSWCLDLLSYSDLSCFMWSRSWGRCETSHPAIK